MPGVKAKLFSSMIASNLLHQKKCNAAFTERMSHSTFPANVSVEARSRGRLGLLRFFQVFPEVKSNVLNVVNGET